MDRKETGKRSRNKGKAGERELAGVLRDYGYDCRRGQQFCGSNGDAAVSYTHLTLPTTPYV